MKEMKKHNREFVESGEYKKYQAEKYPRKKTAIVSCMDTRLVELLPAALGIKNGDVKLIKTAGGLVTDPFDSSMRSILIGIYELGVENVMIIAHTGCGVHGMEAEEMVSLMKKRGITDDAVKEVEKLVDLKKWLTGFNDTENAVAESVKLVKNHPLMPKGITVTGHVIDTATGELKDICTDSAN